MQDYVQKSMTTTLPRKLSGVRGAEFSQATAPSNAGNSPSIGGPDEAALVDIMAPPVIAPLPACTVASGWITSINDCSMRLVLVRDRRVKTPVSHPSAIATTATMTATPKPRRSHSPAPKERFSAAKTRLPAKVATASEVIPPSAYANSKRVVSAL